MAKKNRKPSIVAQNMSNTNTRGGKNGGYYDPRFDSHDDDEIIQMDTFRKKSKPVEILPKNKRQEEYLDLLNDRRKSIIFATGPAGCGKSYLPTLYAIRELKAGRIKKIVITRPAVSTEEAHGFLPGDIFSKMQPWCAPLLDIFEEHWSLQTIEYMVEQKIIEIAPLAYIRGRTFKDSIIIGDECQNSSISVLKALLTRIGEGSKMIITGDVNQFERGFEFNGLRDFVGRLKESGSDLIGMVEFERKHIERHPVVAEVLRIYGED